MSRIETIVVLIGAGALLAASMMSMLRMEELTSTIYVLYLVAILCLAMEIPLWMRTQHYFVRPGAHPSA